MLKYIFRMLFRDARPKQPIPEPKVEAFRNPVTRRWPITEPKKPTPEPKIEPFRKPVVRRRPIAEPKRPSMQPTSKSIKGKCYVIDGDTIVISGTKIRIAGIDAPVLDHPWGIKSKFAVVQMCKGDVVTAEIKEEVSYDRLVAKCYLSDGTDIAAELVKQGLALDWPRYSGGEYRQFEPAGIRKKLWRAAPLCQDSCPPLYFSSISQVGGIGR